MTLQPRENLSSARETFATIIELARGRDAASPVAPRSVLLISAENYGTAGPAALGVPASTISLPLSMTLSP
jgi:hypothetical protein